MQLFVAHFQEPAIPTVKLGGFVLRNRHCLLLLLANCWHQSCLRFVSNLGCTGVRVFAHALFATGEPTFTRMALPELVFG